MKFSKPNYLIRALFTAGAASITVGVSQIRGAEQGLLVAGFLAIIASMFLAMARDR